MTYEPDIERLHDVVRRLVIDPDNPAARVQVLGPPLAIENPNGTLHSWFVPILKDGGLFGYVQVLPDFQPFNVMFVARAPQPAAPWLDPATVRELALALALPEEKALTPWLTYHEFPQRVAWVVPLERPDGKTRIVFVSAGHAYEPGPGGGIG